MGEHVFAVYDFSSPGVQYFQKRSRQKVKKRSGIYRRKPNCRLVKIRCSTAAMFEL